MIGSLPGCEWSIGIIHVGRASPPSISIAASQHRRQRVSQARSSASTASAFVRCPAAISAARATRSRLGCHDQKSDELPPDVDVDRECERNGEPDTRSTNLDPARGRPQSVQVVAHDFDGPGAKRQARPAARVPRWPDLLTGATIHRRRRPWSAPSPSISAGGAHGGQGQCARRNE